MSILTSYSQLVTTSVDFDPFADGDLLLTAPATEAQKEIWLSVQLGDDANCAYNESVSLKIRGALSLSNLDKALQSLVQRHEALRTTISPDGTTLCISSSANVSMSLVDLTVNEADKSDQIRFYLQQAVESPFDLEHGPLLRAVLLRVLENEHLLILTAHHIICDGWSWGVIIPELGKFYTGLQRGIIPELEEIDCFSDYALESATTANNEETLASEEYWLKQFSDSVPVLNLPTDYPRPPLRSFSSKCEVRSLDQSLAVSLKQLGAKLGCSFMTTLLGAFEVFLHRLTGQTDLVVGIPSAGQAATGRYTLVGHCVNLLPLRTQIIPSQSFSDYLVARQSHVLDAYDNQNFTFGRLVQKLSIPRDTSRIPLVSTIFNIDKALESDQLAFVDLEVEFKSNPRTSENFELSVNLTEFRERVILEWEYGTHLFSNETVKQQIAAFETLLRGIVAEPDLEIFRLSFVPESDLKLLTSWNQARIDPRSKVTIHQLFEAQAEQIPTIVAVRFDQQLLTYRELNEKANQLAHYLQSLGLGVGNRVGICLNRSLEMAIAFLGVLKAGCAYVPLDPNYPIERLAFMAQDSQVKTILTCSTLKSFVPENSCPTFCLDSDWPTVDQFSIQNPNSNLEPSEAAYVIYTSGSTGVPKGVLVAHQGLVNHCLAMAQSFSLTTNDRVMQFASISFDIAVEEIFPTWISGATLVLRKEEILASIDEFLHFVEKEQITILDLPTAFWHEWVNQLEESTPLPDCVRLVVVGGEKASRTAYRKWTQMIGSQCRWLNTYGPTETTVTATLYDPEGQLEETQVDIPIGKPIANVQTYVLDPQKQPVLIGLPGELYIGGLGVAIGYHNRPEVTLERFIPNPFSRQSNDRLYKTGDLVRYLSDGNLEFLGRIDSQVKVRGFRIEIGEIEAAIVAHSDVQQVAVILKEESPTDQRLVAYIISTQSAETLINEIRQTLVQKLPTYMMPSAFICLDSFPLTPNGKIDLKQLPNPTYQSMSASQYEAPRTPLEQQIADIWATVLRLDRVSIHSNFFELGGHSLLATQVIARLRKTLNLNITLRNLFELPTVAKLADKLKAMQWASHNSERLESSSNSDYEEGEL
jgi:amino acid adenylation domain-containing protein